MKASFRFARLTNAIIRQRFMNIPQFFQKLLASKWFFVATIGIFTAASLWVTFFSLYPMAFDEDFHMGLIKIYATSWLPYGIEHTRDMATYGAATADASYLWHYLLSFPYRLMELLGWSERWIVTVLRIINITFVVVALFVYRKIFLEAGLGRAKSNLALAFFTLIPILPVLAGQVNYDNPLLLLIALSFLYALRWQRKFRSNKKIPTLETWLLLIIMLFAAPVKYAYLPIAAGIIAWLGLVIARQKKLKWKKQWRHFVTQTKKFSLRVKALGIAALVLGSFFSAHYATNYINYGSLTPPCDVVFDKYACLNYGPWGRNFLLAQDLDPSFKPKPISSYVVEDWIPGMSKRLTFAVAGPTNGHQTKEPLPSVVTFLNILTIAGLVCVLLTFRKILSYPLATLILTVVALYVGLLVIRLYDAYSLTGEAVAINGRYLLPLLPLVAACFIYSASIIASRFKLGRYGAFIGFISLIVLILAGGGITTYALLSEPHWYW